MWGTRLAEMIAARIGGAFVAPTIAVAALRTGTPVAALSVLVALTVPAWSPVFAATALLPVSVGRGGRCRGICRRGGRGAWATLVLRTIATALMAVLFSVSVFAAGTPDLDHRRLDSGSLGWRGDGVRGSNLGGRLEEFDADLKGRVDRRCRLCWSVR